MVEMCRLVQRGLVYDRKHNWIAIMLSDSRRIRNAEWASNGMCSSQKLSTKEKNLLPWPRIDVFD